MEAGRPVGYAFEALLGEGPVLLSGGFGTELGRRGCDPRLPLWSARALLDDPEAVRHLHADYLRAGARVLTTNTFRADPRTVADARRERTHIDVVKTAARLAREAVAEASPGHTVLVAGSVGPIADCYDPGAVPDEAALRQAHGQRVWAQVCAEVDLVFLETLNTIREAVAALDATRPWLPAAVSFVCAPGGRLLSGEPIADAAAAVEPYEPLAILVNCCAPSVATEALASLLAATRRPVGVYANGRGRPDDEHGWRFEGGTPDRAYVREAGRWLDMGARLVGGCCGTSPRTIERLAGLLRERT